MVKNLRLLAFKFELDQSQHKSTQVLASRCKWVAKRNASWTQVQNLCRLASPFGQGFNGGWITSAKATRGMVFDDFDIRRNINPARQWKFGMVSAGIRSPYGEYRQQDMNNTYETY